MILTSQDSTKEILETRKTFFCQNKLDNKFLLKNRHFCVS